MDSMVLKKTTFLLFILFSASLFSPSLAGGQWRYMAKSAVASRKAEEIPRKQCHSARTIHSHSRILKVNTKDYATYDPAPTLVKPPFKLIPN